MRHLRPNRALQPGAERQEFLRDHGITTRETQESFKARMNQLDHYGVQ